ncbi:hypothetical protein J6590_100173 [Homalodisca vitripennis]|nr:hypothetical protein J6590_100173 [Homalodisca vitripennis]
MNSIVLSSAISYKHRTAVVQFAALERTKMDQQQTVRRVAPYPCAVAYQRMKTCMIGQTCSYWSLLHHLLRRNSTLLTTSPSTCEFQISSCQGLIAHSDARPSKRRTPIAAPIKSEYKLNKVVSSSNNTDHIDTLYCRSLMIKKEERAQHRSLWYFSHHKLRRGFMPIPAHHLPSIDLVRSDHFEHSFTETIFFKLANQNFM